MIWKNHNKTNHIIAKCTNVYSCTRTFNWQWPPPEGTTRMPPNASRGLVILSAVMLFCSGYLIVKLVDNVFLAIRKKLYGDPVYKQNVADIRDRNRRLKQGQECSLMKISVLSSAGRQDPGVTFPSTMWIRTGTYLSPTPRTSRGIFWEGVSKLWHWFKTID